MMDISKHVTAASSTAQFCCKPSPPSGVLANPSVQSQNAAAVMATKHPTPPPQLEHASGNGSSVVLYVANNSTNFTSQPSHSNSTLTDASSSSSSFQFQQFHQQIHQPAPPPSYHSTSQNYQPHFQTSVNSFGNEYYQQQQQHVRNNCINKRQNGHVIPTSTTTNSIYNSKVNLFQTYYHQNIYDDNKQSEVDTTQHYSGPPPPTGYIATVTAVAGGSPTGNVSSSSYFSSNSSSPSTSCMTPRSTSRCDSARSVESSCSSTDSGVEMTQIVLSATSSSSYPSPCSTTTSVATSSASAPPPPNLVFVSLPNVPPQQPVVNRPPAPVPHVSPLSHNTSVPVVKPPSPLAPVPTTDISVPSGWRRLLVNNTIVYVSPSGAELCSREALRQYLATAGTCKCGLECPLHLDRIFSFDPKVINRTWPLTTEPSELTRLCNHKRKHLIQQQQQQAPRSPLHRNLHHDPATVNKDCVVQQQQHQHSHSGTSNLGHIKRRRRKNHGPYDGVLVSQLLAQRDRLVHHQQPSIAVPPPPQQPPVLPPPPSAVAPIAQQNNKDVPLRSWDPMNQIHQLQPPPAPPPPSLPVQQIHQQQSQFHPPSQQQQQPQIRPQCNTMMSTMGASPPVHIQQQQLQQQQQQQPFRQFPMMNTAPNSGDTRILHDMHKQQLQQPQQQQQMMYGVSQPFTEHHISKQQPRPPPPPYIAPYNATFNFQQQQQQQQQIVPVVHNQPPSTPVSQPGPLWNATVQCQEMYEREMPLHRLSWDDVSKRKKIKSKRPKSNNQCPNIDVRQIPIENKIHQQQIQQPQQSFIQADQNSGGPSFMEDPNGYLAQQTALLNSTILRQTGVNIINNQRPPPTSLDSSPTTFSTLPLSTASSSSPMSAVVPLPSNIIVAKQQGMTRTSTTQNTVIISQSNPVSSSFTTQPLSLPDSASECQACSMNNAAAAAALYQASIKETLSPEENPVTSSTLTQDKASPNPDPKGPIQGGTVSTSEITSNKNDTETVPSPSSSTQQSEIKCEKCPCETTISNQVTTVASGRTVSSNTITSVQAGKALTAQTVTVSVSNVSPHSSSVNTSPTFPINVTKSPLEMVQSVVSSIQVPPPPPTPQVPQQQIKIENGSQIIDHSQLLKSGLPPGHILVSSNGQLIMAAQPQKLLNATHQPPVSTTSSLSQMIPTMNMGQPMVQLVNTLPCNGPLLLQSGMIPQTVTVEGMGSPLHLTLTGNVLHQGQLTSEDRTIITSADLLGSTMVHKKKGKKRKSSPQTVASMLQLHNSPMIMQNFQIPAQQQAPLLQAVTILPNNKTQFLQFPANTPQQQNGSQNSQQHQAQQQFSNLGGHLITSPQNSINLIQPFNLLNGGGGFMPNFPLQQILQGGTTLVVPSLQGLQGMVSLPDGTLVSSEPNHGTVQLQLQNVNGQQVLTSLPGQNMFGTQQNLIATPGMVIRTPGPQAQVISNKITTAGQMISQNGQLISPQSQFLVNGAFTQQTALNGLMVNTGQQVTLAPQNTSPSGPQNATLRGPLQGDFIQCMNVNGQPMIIPNSNNQSSVPTSQPQQNAATLLQQNTTIVQQQTTLVANNPLQQNTTAAANAIVNPNFILNSNLLPKPFQDLAAPLLLQKHSVSTQTAGAQTQTIMPSTTAVAQIPVSTPVTTVALSSPPDTTTHSAPADTTTSSPLCEPTKSSTPTADFVSSSEPDPETYAWANRTLAAFTAEEEVESSTKPPETPQMSEEKRVVACKRKHSDLLVIEARADPAHELDDPAETVTTGPRNLSVGDLVWGPARGFPSWPGKLVAMEDDDFHSVAAAKAEAAPSSCQTPSSPSLERKVWVRWFGDVTTPTQVDLRLLKTLSEGLEAHHRATKKLRKGRKMNSQLENAIQEAMIDLDLMTSKKNDQQGTNSNEATATTNRYSKKSR